jgi:hypothetical protein
MERFRHEVCSADGLGPMVDATEPELEASAIADEQRTGEGNSTQSEAVANNRK